MELLLVGVIARAHGLKGEVTVIAHNPDSPIWVKGQRYHVVERALVTETADSVTVDGAKTLSAKLLRRTPDSRFICAFDELTDRDSAEAHEGFHLGVPIEAVPATSPDEIYHRELKGYEVTDRFGTVLGTVVGVFPGPAQDLVEVEPPRPAGHRGKRPETWYVPFVEAFILEVDRSARRLVIDTPEGLLP
jgi:16S rRNA processing protein RimM